jgi:hypothetical protein
LIEVKSEREVEYLFFRYHHLLNLELKEIRWEFPDYIVSENGVEKYVECEYLLSRYSIHYANHRKQKTEWKNPDGSTYERFNPSNIDIIIFWEKDFIPKPLREDPNLCKIKLISLKEKIQDFEKEKKDMRTSLRYLERYATDVIEREK